MTSCFVYNLASTSALMSFRLAFESSSRIDVGSKNRFHLTRS